MDQPLFAPTGEAPLLTAGPRWRGEAWGAADSFPHSRGRFGGDAAPLQPRCPCGSGEGAQTDRASPAKPQLCPAAAVRGLPPAVPSPRAAVSLRGGCCG